MGSSANAIIKMNLSDVLDLVERNITGTLGVANGKQQLLIDCGSDDTVKLTDLSSWPQESTNLSFDGHNQMSYLNQNMQLLIEQSVLVTI